MATTTPVRGSQKVFTQPAIKKLAVTRAVTSNFEAFNHVLKPSPWRLFNDIHPPSKSLRKVFERKPVMWIRLC
jgi:hypothetical protein